MNNNSKKVSDIDLTALNNPQKVSIETLDGPLLVLAGAGTGKTKVLTIRLSQILKQQKALPYEILAVTFTNKAAKEMRERIRVMIGHQEESLWLGTFHSLGVRILRRYADRIGLNFDFSILDTDDQIRLIKQILKENNIEDKRWTPRLVSFQISRWKDKGWLPSQVPDSEVDSQTPFLQVYRLYQDRLKLYNSVDFGDLLLLPLYIFQTCEDVLSVYQKQFKYILVDEYQDTNVTQYLWLRLLAQVNKNICCVGDDDQSIYSWRGAEVKNILRFEKDFPGAKVIRLEQNYRSNGYIIEAASGVIDKNEDRLRKKIWTQKAKGEKVSLGCFYNTEEEAIHVCGKIESLQQQKINLNEIAILVRASFQMRELEERLIVLGIPYRVIGGSRFYDRMEIRDVLAYLRVIAYNHDSLAFERIINVPRRGIGPTTLKSIHIASNQEKISLEEATRLLLKTDEMRGSTKDSLSIFLSFLDSWRQEVEKIPLRNLVEKVLDESGYLAMWQNEKSLEATSRVENIKEFLESLSEYPTLIEFLEHVSLVTDYQNQENEAKISLMTLHSAKGLEFDYVFLSGWEEGVFPHQRSLEESGSSALEEERRLAYVGITRAKIFVSISYSKHRKAKGIWQSYLPSRFIMEIPQETVEVLHKNSSHASSGSRFSNYRSNWSSSSAVKEKIDSDEEGFSSGSKVFHNKFGYGWVQANEGDIIKVNFQHTGIKNVLKSFLKKS